jgi:hypothetical protein
MMSWTAGVRASNGRSVASTRAKKGAGEDTGGAGA